MSFLSHLFPRALSRSEAERDYLNQSVSRYDLESRERDISRGLFAGYPEPSPKPKPAARRSAGSPSSLTSRWGKGMEMLFSLKMSHSAK